MRAKPQPSPPNHVLQELISFTRRNSPFYRSLWENVPEDASSLDQLPIINHTKFWASNTTDISTNRVITGPILDGGIFRTGGTTSAPKVSFYTRDEVHMITRQVGDCLIRAGVLPGDRVANLLYGGELYMGFLLGIFAWLDSTTPYVQLPISGGSSVEGMVMPMRDFNATVAIAMPTTLLRIASHLVTSGSQLPHVRLLVYGGEGLYEDQKSLLAKGFPNAVVRPLMYGSVDGGLIGIPVHDPKLDSRVGGAVYSVNSPNVAIELLREDGMRISDVGERGLVYVTLLTRRLMPVIRYPTGDVAEWVDASMGQFVLRGRDLVGFRIGPTSYDFKHMRALVLDVIGADNLEGFQVVARRREGKDQMVFRITTRVVQDAQKAFERLEGALIRESMEYLGEVKAGYINQLAVEWVNLEDLTRSSRTGKLLHTVDERY